MEAGKRDKRVTIEQPDGTRSSGAGELQPNWTEFAQVWAELEPTTGREALMGKQLGAEQTWQMKINYLDGLNTKMRVVWGTVTLTIDSISPFYRKNRMELLCTQRTTD